MNIRKKLALKFCFIVGALFIIFSAAIYFFSSLHQESEFRIRLKNRGITIAQLLNNVEDIDNDLLKEIESNTKNALFYEGISIYSIDNKLIYNFDKKFLISPKTVNKIGAGADLNFLIGKNEAVGFIYSGKINSYKIIVSAFDQLGFEELESLRIILIIAVIFSILSSYIAGWIFSGHALNPISKIVSNVNNITASKLSLRLDEGRGLDEIERLATTFNKMLDRLEKAFDLQRGFVSNASHELRTPLTSMKGHIEVTLNKEREVKEYMETLQLLLEEVENLNKISNNLLQLALATTDIGALKLKNVRVDEMLFAGREELLKTVMGYKANIAFLTLPENELLLSTFGNEQLIKSALYNLMDNACKYSENKAVEITFKADGGKIELLFKDNGIGIPEEEITKIFQPFYRASNSNDRPGSGLGLSLTKKIVELHKGTININSKLNVGTEIRIAFPSVSA